jgi:hypothetical protein
MVVARWPAGMGQCGHAVVQRLPAGGQALVEGLLMGNGTILASRLQTPDDAAASASAGSALALDGSGSWSAPTPIVSSLVCASRPVIVTTPDDIQRTVWESNGYVYYAYSLGNGSWGRASLSTLGPCSMSFGMKAIGS